MQAVSTAIFDQLQKLDEPKRKVSGSASSPGRQLMRGAPISSSRNDPLPNEAFPTPLPAVPLPYELSLLDNLFVNPMMAHTKASDYTNGCKTRANQQHKSVANDVRFAYTNPGSSNSYGIPQSAQPGTGETSSCPPVPQALGQLSTSGANNGLGPYGMAAQVRGSSGTGTQTSDLDQSLAMFGTLTGGNGTGHNAASGGLEFGTIADGVNNSFIGEDTQGGTAAGNFDIFSFLMDEDGAWGGNQNWDNVEMPADYPLWS